MATLSTSQSEFWRAVFSAAPFKPGQGKYARWGTFAALGVVIAAGFYSWSAPYPASEWLWKWAIPIPVGLVCLWVAYRIVNLPRFADFLITTEAEMAKVKWPTWNELRVATAVILITVVLLAVYLFAVDLIWKYVLGLLRILRVDLPFGANM
jgi:preprotein translocase subunit SecE